LSKISQEEEEKQEGKKKESDRERELTRRTGFEECKSRERERERGGGWFLTLCYSLFIDYLLFLPVVSKVPKER
jgi:hypothetical protein